MKNNQRPYRYDMGADCFELGYLNLSILLLKIGIRIKVDFKRYRIHEEHGLIPYQLRGLSLISAEVLLKKHKNFKR